MSDIAERVKKIVVEHLGVEADKVTERRQLHRRPRRRQSRHRRTRHGVRGGVRLRNSRRRGRDDPHGRRRRQVPREERQELIRCGMAAQPGIVPGRGVASVRSVERPRSRHRQAARKSSSLAGVRRNGVGPAIDGGQVRARAGHEACRRHRHRNGDAAWLRRRGDLAAPARRPKRRTPHRDLRRLRPRRARSPAGDPARRRLRTAPSIPISGWSRRSSARSIDFIIYAMSAAAQALDDAGWQPARPEEQCSDRRDDRLRHRRHRAASPRPRSC